MSPGKVQDPEGAKMIIVSFNTAAGAVASIIKRRFLITCYTEADTCRLRLDAALTAGDKAGVMKGAKNILIYDSNMHPISSMDPSKCGTCITARDRATWAVTTLKFLEQFPSIKLPDDGKDTTRTWTLERVRFPRHKQQPPHRTTRESHQATRGRH
jgi:hypothetical protein